MTQITIKGFADQIGIPPDTLLRQLDAAGISAKQADDELTDEEKEKLFHYLRASHGATDEAAAKKKITLKRKSTSQVVQSTRTGASRTVQVEGRKKRTFIKRTAIEETPSAAEEAPVEEIEPVAAAVPVEAPMAAHANIVAESAAPAPVLAPPIPAKGRAPGPGRKPAAPGQAGTGTRQGSQETAQRQERTPAKTRGARARRTASGGRQEAATQGQDCRP